MVVVVNVTPVMYTDSTGYSPELISSLMKIAVVSTLVCVVASFVVLSGGSGLVVVGVGVASYTASMSTVAIVSGSVALVSATLAISLSARNAVQEDTKSIAISSTKSKANQTTIYRWGSGTNMNLTPRMNDNTGLSYSLTPPTKGNYTTTTMEAVNATGVLIAINDGPNHVSVLPIDVTTMYEWQLSRGNANEDPHYYPQILQSIRTK